MPLWQATPDKSKEEAPSYTPPKVSARALKLAHARGTHLADELPGKQRNCEDVRNIAPNKFALQENGYFPGVGFWNSLTFDNMSQRLPSLAWPVNKKPIPLQKKCTYRLHPFC